MPCCLVTKRWCSSEWFLKGDRGEAGVEVESWRLMMWCGGGSRLWFRSRSIEEINFEIKVLSPPRLSWCLKWWTSCHKWFFFMCKFVIGLMWQDIFWHIHLTSMLAWLWNDGRITSMLTWFCHTALMVCLAERPGRWIKPVHLSIGHFDCKRSAVSTVSTLPGIIVQTVRWVSGECVVGWGEVCVVTLAESYFVPYNCP